jgi:hypothetical protein
MKPCTLGYHIIDTRAQFILVVAALVRIVSNCAQRKGLDRLDYSDGEYGPRCLSGRAAMVGGAGVERALDFDSLRRTSCRKILLACSNRRWLS